MSTNSIKQVSLKFYKWHDVDLIALHVSGVPLGKIAKKCLRAMVNNEPFSVQPPSTPSPISTLPNTVTIKLKLHPDQNNEDKKIIKMLEQIPSGYKNSFIKNVIRSYFENDENRFAVFGLGREGIKIEKETEKEKEKEKDSVQPTLPQAVKEEFKMDEIPLDEIQKEEKKEIEKEEKEKEKIKEKEDEKQFKKENYEWTEEQQEQQEQQEPEPELESEPELKQTAEPVLDGGRGTEDNAEMSDMLSMFGMLAHMK